MAAAAGRWPLPVPSGNGGARGKRLWELASGTELARWETDMTSVVSCVAPHNSTTLVYGDVVGRVVVESLR